MSRTSFKKRNAKDVVKWVVVVLAFLLLTTAVVSLFVKLDRQTNFTTIGPESYSIGTLDENGKYKESDKSIYLRDAVTVDGFKCELEEDSKITYKLYFYDKDNDYLAVSGDLAEDYDGSNIPVGAETVRVVITPTADEDGKVSLTEVYGYAKQLTVTISK